MRRAVGGHGLLGGLVAREVAMRLAVVGITVVGTQNHWQPPRLASDALLFLNAQSGMLRCGRVERCVVSEALGLLHGSEVVAHAVIVVHLALLIVRRVGPAGDGLGSDDLRRTG